MESPDYTKKYVLLIETINRRMRMETILDILAIIGGIYFVLCLFITYIVVPTIEAFETKTDKELEDIEWLKKNIHNIRGL